MSQDGMLPLQPLPRPDQRGQLLTKSDTIWVSFRRERMRLSGQAGVRVTRICHGGAQTGVKRVRTRTHERAPTQMTEAGSLLTGHDPARTRGIRPYLSLTARLARRKMIEADGLGPPRLRSRTSRKSRELVASPFSYAGAPRAPKVAEAILA